MAVFADDQETWQRLDFSLLRHGSVHLYHAPDVLEADIAWLRAEAYRVYRFACKDWNDEADALADIGETLSFLERPLPDLNGFSDDLSDIDIPQKGGVVLVFTGFDVFARQYSRPAWDILDIIADNSRRFLLTGRRLMALAQSDDPRFAVEPVGASPVTWNAREWPDIAV